MWGCIYLQTQQQTTWYATVWHSNKTTETACRGFHSPPLLCIDLSCGSCENLFLVKLSGRGFWIASQSEQWFLWLSVLLFFFFLLKRVLKLSLLFTDPLRLCYIDNCTLKSCRMHWDVRFSHLSVEKHLLLHQIGTVLFGAEKQWMFMCFCLPSLRKF